MERTEIRIDDFAALIAVVAEGDLTSAFSGVKATMGDNPGGSRSAGDGLARPVPPLRGEKAAATEKVLRIQGKVI